MDRPEIESALSGIANVGLELRLRGLESQMLGRAAMKKKSFSKMTS